MLEPRNDEERKALRLKNGINGTSFDGFTDDLSRMWWVMNLAEARAIVREEQDGKQADFNARVGDAWELSKVREDIARTAAVVQALNSDIATYTPGEPPPGVSSETTRQTDRLCRLLVRERELTAKAEPEGGDRG